MYLCKEVGAMKAHIFNNSKFFSITVTANINPIKDYDAVKDAFSMIADYCKEHNGVILHERIFAASSLQQNVKEARKAAYGINHSAAYTYIHCQPLFDDCLAGINIQGVYCSENRPKNVFLDNNIIGSKWSDDDIDVILLHDIHNADVNVSSFEQTKNMFLSINEILKCNDFEFRNICRTWIYLDHILNQYDDFNKGRNEAFHELRLLQNQADDNKCEQIYMPASTGINGGNGYKANGIIDVLAVKAKSDKIQIYSDNGKLQNSAYRYGSAFSRSLVVENQCTQQKIIYLSGTASIDKSGQTVFHNDIDKQISMTFDVINKLIQEHNASFNNLCEGTVFLKSREYLQNFLDYCAGHGLTELPVIITVADVCRDNLLFEMDATFMVDNKIG